MPSALQLAKEQDFAEEEEMCSPQDYKALAFK